MRRLSFRGLWLTGLIILSVWVTAVAQQPAIDAYHARIITQDGKRFRGTLTDVTNSEIYLTDYKKESRFYDLPIPLIAVRRVVLRRQKQQTERITGAVLGGLALGYLANQSFSKNPSRSPALQGLSVTLAAAAGAGGGLLIGALVVDATGRVVRPLDPGDPKTSLIRQLEPFTLRYQQDILDRLPGKRY